MQEDFLVGRPSQRCGPYTLVHDQYYGPHLSSVERAYALSNQKIFRSDGLLSLRTPIYGIVDPSHFTSCILEEYIRRPAYFQKMFSESNEHLWSYFLPLWKWYFPSNYLNLKENCFLKASFESFCGDLWNGSGRNRLSAD
jgi:hypothetical protein